MGISIVPNVADGKDPDLHKYSKLDKASKPVVLGAVT
jgi:hypothetical protein